MKNSIIKLDNICKADLSDTEKAVYEPALKKLRSLRKQFLSATKTDHKGPIYDESWSKRRGLGAGENGALSTADLNKVLVFYSDKDGWIPNKAKNTDLQSWIELNKEHLSREDIEYLNAQAKQRCGTLLNGNYASLQELQDRDNEDIMKQFAKDIEELQKQHEADRQRHAQIVNERTGQALAIERAKEHKENMNMYK